MMLSNMGSSPVFAAALGTCMWANSRMIRRARESEYGWYDPRKALAAWNGIELPIFIAAVTIGAAAGKGIAALH
jgi:hypothetical protein